MITSNFKQNMSGRAQGPLFLWFGKFRNAYSTDYTERNPIASVQNFAGDGFPWLVRFWSLAIGIFLHVPQTFSIGFETLRNKFAFLKLYFLGFQSKLYFH